MNRFSAFPAVVLACLCALEARAQTSIAPRAVSFPIGPTGLSAPVAVGDMNSILGSGLDIQAAPAAINGVAAAPVAENLGLIARDVDNTLGAAGDFSNASAGQASAAGRRLEESITRSRSSAPPDAAAVASGQQFLAAPGGNLIANKNPWQMSRQEWLAAGSPDLAIKWAYGLRAKTPPPWDNSLGAEIKAINDFLDLFEDPIKSFRLGEVADPKRAEPERQREFAAARWWHQHLSHFPGSVEAGKEDARESIIVGRKLGYRDQDILYYVIRNYIIAPFMPEIMEQAYRAGRYHEAKVFENAEIPERVRKIFHIFRKSKTR